MPVPSKGPAGGRAEILAAATDLFGDAGFDAVSISTIARRAGTSKANVFHHFGCKEELYLEVMRSACNVFAKVFEDSDDTVTGPGDRLRTLIRRDIEIMQANPDRAHLIMREVLESSPRRGRALAGEVFDEQFRELVTLFEEGRDAGDFRDDVPAPLAATMMIACNVFLFQSRNVLRHLPGVDFVDDPDRYATLVSRVLREGLQRRPDPAGRQGNQT